MVPSNLSDTNAVHILLVEDDPNDAEIVRQTLLRAGQGTWKLVQVERLQEAIAVSQEFRSQAGQDFDVVLLDLRLPDSTGLDTVVQFHQAIPTAPIVVLTTLNDETLALKSIRAGAQDYLAKDEITIQQLLRSIKFAIERQAARESN
jgi:DNA-binding response OmpR family regulator